MNGVLGHDSALQGCTGQGTTWVNEMNFVMDHAPGAGSIARPVDHYNCPMDALYRSFGVNTNSAYLSGHQVLLNPEQGEGRRREREREREEKDREREGQGRRDNRCEIQTGKTEKQGVFGCIREVEGERGRERKRMKQEDALTMKKLNKLQNLRAAER